MSYDYGTTPISPLDSPSEEPPSNRNRTLIIIVVVVLVLCLCCIVIPATVYLLWTYGDQLFGISQQLAPLLI
jgi:hypothetical protein